MSVADHPSTSKMITSPQSQNRSNLLKRLMGLPWWAWIGAADLFFIGMTTVIPYLPQGVHRWLVYFDLAIEMNLGAWWSSMNLLALGALAMERLPSERAWRKWAWGLLAVILFTLSLDELGSIHERAGGMRNLLPYIALYIVLLGVALLILFFMGKDRKTAVLLGVMFALFGSAILQEQIEHITHWPAWMAGIRTGMEEGSEILGMFIGFLTFVRLRERSKGIYDVLARLHQLPHLIYLLAGGLALHAVLVFWISPGYRDNGWGNPAIWYPVAVFFLLAMAAMWAYRSGNQNKLWLVLAAYWLLSSAAGVYLISPRESISIINKLGPLSNFYIFYAIQLILAGAMLVALRRGRIWQILFGLAALAATLALSAWIGTLAARFAVAGILAFGLAILQLSLL